MINRKDISPEICAPLRRNHSDVRIAKPTLRFRNSYHRASQTWLGVILFIAISVLSSLNLSARESKPGELQSELQSESAYIQLPDSAGNIYTTFPDTKHYFHSVNEGCNCECVGSPCWVDANGDPVARRILLKSNIPAWAMLWSNVAAEIDIVPHWSLEVPVYWSPFNYGTRTLKFRTFSIIPKMRYWLSKNNDGLFFDLHAGFAYYNIAFGKDKRYQDHNGSRPAVGGGFGIGYRFRLPNPRWKIEVAAGAGVYSLDYDIFENVKNGLKQSRVQRTFFGLDNFAVSVSYEFYVRPRNKDKKQGLTAGLKEGGGL